MRICSPLEQKVEQYLTELRADEPSHRVNAARALGNLGSATDEVVSALDSVAQSDRDENVRAAAREALTTLGRPPPLTQRRGRGKVYITRNEKIVDFAIGFGGWFAINGAIWHFLSQDKLFTGLYSSVGLCTFPLNILALLIAIIIRRWLGLGWLSAIAANLIAALFVGILINGTCAVPFYVKTN